MVFGAGGGGGTGDILTDDQDYKLRGLTELQTTRPESDRGFIYENVLLSGQPLT